MIHSPTAFMKGTEIWLRYNERPEPRHHAYPMDEQDYDEEFKRNRAYWKYSFREVKFHDQEAIQKWVDGLDCVLYDEIKEGGYIKLDAIAGRIEIRQQKSGHVMAMTKTGIVNTSPDKLVAVLLPAEKTKEESQEDLLKALLLALADKQDALSKFIITRRK